MITAPEFMAAAVAGAAGTEILPPVGVVKEIVAV